MKKIFLVLSLISLNAFAQTSRVPPVNEVPQTEPCCAKCAGPNALVNPDQLVPGPPPSCKGNDFQLIMVAPGKCVHNTIQNHKHCKR